MNKLSIKAWQWGLYDFANSLANIAVSFYFTLWFVENLKGTEAGISIVVAIVTILLLCSLPQIGARADHHGHHARLLTILTGGTIVTLCALAFAAFSIKEPSLWSSLLILGIYGVFQYLYQSSVSVYTSLLRFVGTIGSNEEVRVAGVGNAMGQLGNVIGLLVALPVATTFGRPAAFLSGAILFLLFVLPALRWIRKLETKALVAPAPIKFIAAWKELRRSPDVFHYLVGYYLFADAVLTLQLFLTLYLTIVAKLSDSAKTLIMAAALLVAVAGAMLAKYIVRRMSVKKAIETSILFWAILLTLFALVSHPILFIIITLLNGFAFGVLFSLSQAYYSTLVPPEQQGRYFGIYTIFERASSLLGPLLWSVVIIAFSSYGEWRYRLAVLSLAFLVLLSLAFIRKVKDSSVAEQQ
ncbi:MAG: MFS transporter [Patescibacteria group bacterium]